MLLSQSEKRHLTPLEKSIGLRPAGLDSQEHFRFADKKVGLAICLDGFHHHYLSRLDALGCDIVVQPSANFAPWDRSWPADPNATEGEAWLRYGLRQGVQGRSHLAYGVNPMLVCDFAGLRAEGCSSIVANQDFHANTLLQLAPSPREECVLRARVSL